MRSPLHLVALVAALFLLSSAASGARRSDILAGRWDPIKNINDPHVLEVAKFAVREHNKAANAKLAFEKVIAGKTQEVSGVNYWLVVATEDRVGVKTYEAIVWEKPWMHFMNLTSFQPLNVNL